MSPTIIQTSGVKWPISKRAFEKSLRLTNGLQEAFFGKGNSIPFVIAIVFSILPIWRRQNSAGYHGPQIFSAVNPFKLVVWSVRPLETRMIGHRNENPASFFLAFMASAKRWL